VFILEFKDDLTDINQFEIKLKIIALFIKYENLVIGGPAVYHLKVLKDWAAITTNR